MAAVAVEAAEAATLAAAAAGSTGAEAAPVAAAAPKSTLVFPPTHRYAQEELALLKAFKETVAEDPKNPAHGWTVLDTKKDVLVSKKTGTTPLGLLRGDGIIAGYTPFDVFTVATMPECRKIWDELFDEARAVENLDGSAVLSYAATKGKWPTSGRDLSVLLVNEFLDDGRIFTMSVSVKDDKIPEVKGRVRATLKMNGWYLEPLAGGQKGTRVVYLNEIDLNGWIPEAILKMVALQIPMAVADVRKYLTRHGPPAFITRSGGYTAEAPTVDHAASRLTVKLKVDNTVSPFTQISCSQQRYPTGIVATVQPADAVRIEWSEAGRALLLHHDDAGKNGTVLTITVEPYGGPDARVVVSGATLHPAGAAPAAEAAPAAAAGPPVAAAAAAAAAPAPAAALPQLDDILRRLERIERAVAEGKHAEGGASAVTVGAGVAFLVGVPVVAILAARYT